MTAVATKQEPKPAAFASAEEPIEIARLTYQGSVTLQDVNDTYPMQYTSEISVVKGWRILYYPKAGMYRVWSARLAQRKPAPVTVIWREAVTSHLAQGDTEGP